MSEEEQKEIKPTVVSVNKQKDLSHRFKPGVSGNPSGRPVGSKNKKTLEQEVVREEFRNRILLNVYDLLTAQMNIAKGSSYMYRIEETEKGKKKHVLVTDPDEIAEVLDECEGNGVLNDNYYYITTQAPDNRALDSLLDRVFGKSKQQLDITSDGESINDESRAKARKAISGAMPANIGGGE